MHPEHHHASTAKLLDEARWLGFQALGAHTAPPKKDANPLAIAQATPTKTSTATTAMKKLSNLMSSPDFKFRFKSPIPGLSPKSSRLVNQVPESSQSGGRALFDADEFSTRIDLPAERQERKFAIPKGKSRRFSDVHEKEFKKMDSIANHPSAFRADPNRIKPGTGKFSKAQPDKPESPRKPTATPLKRTHSKLDMTESTNPPPSAKSTIRVVPPSRHGVPPPSAQPASPAKRVKRTEEDDAASTRPAVPDEQIAAPKATPARRGLLRSRLMTPTRASIARAQSVKVIKSDTMTPSRLAAPSSSSTNLFSPSRLGGTMLEGIRKTSDSLNKVKSILRTPNIKYSNDMAKVAAGTHMSPPPELNLNKRLPNVPATAPVRKHVNFTESTLLRDTEAGVASPSPSKPKSTAAHPSLGSTVEYPKLPVDNEQTTADSPSRRITFGSDLPGSMPGQFDFASNKPVNFGPATKGTIRMVRKSDASSLIEGRKRKLETPGETSDKENQVEDEGRSTKKVKTSLPEPPKTPKTPSSKLPRRLGKTPGSISKSRLAFLSTPKRVKGA